MKLCFKFNVLIQVYLQLHSLVYSQTPTNGCDAISDQGRCYSYFTHGGINWSNARIKCLAWGGDLATVTSLEENTLMYNTITASDNCWMGLNDVASENTFVWVDGSTSTYRLWKPQPNNDANEDCVGTWIDEYWNDYQCWTLLTCYYCSSIVSPFGEMTGANTYTSLEDNQSLNRNTTLYCITETKNTPQVTWTFKDLYGVTTTLFSTTDATTGVSTLSVTIDKSGYYSCEVSQDGGNTRRYTAVMLDFTLGAPVLTLNHGCSTTLSLLPPAVNRADIPVHTDNVILSANLVGRWQTPDGFYVDSDSIKIPTLNVSHAGLYKFYVTSWDGVWTLAIQIDISPVETDIQTIVNLRAETTNQSSMLVSWGLSEINSYDSERTFSVYFEFGDFQIFAGTTKDLSFELTGLVPNVNYTVRVELQYPYSANTISATTHHLLALSGDTNPPGVALLGNTGTQSNYPGTTTEFPTNTEPSISNTMYMFIAVVVILVAILILVLLTFVSIVCAMKSRKNQTKLPLQVHPNEIYQQIDTTHPMTHNNKLFSYSESVKVSEPKQIELPDKTPDNSNGTANYQ